MKWLFRFNVAIEWNGKLSGSVSMNLLCDSLPPNERLKTKFLPLCWRCLYAEHCLPAVPASAHTKIHVYCGATNKRISFEILCLVLWVCVCVCMRCVMQHRRVQLCFECTEPLALHLHRFIDHAWRIMPAPNESIKIQFNSIQLWAIFICIVLPYSIPFTSTTPFHIFQNRNCVKS